MLERTVNVAMAKEEKERPVAVLVQIASQYESSVYLLTDDKKINAKSIMGMMSIAFTDGKKITVQADGIDEEQAVDKIVEHLTANA